MKTKGLNCLVQEYKPSFSGYVEKEGERERQRARRERERERREN